MATVGDRVRELRTLAGISQRETAGLAGLGEAHVSLIENRTGTITGDTAEKLCEVFGCTLDHLLCGAGKPPSKGKIAKAVAAARKRRDGAADGQVEL